MNEMNFDWDDVRLFLAVARSGGLAPAAAQTGKSAPTLGRRMLALERRLGADLFRRLPRGYALTEDGEALLAQALTLEAALAPIVTRGGPTARPVVKVSAGLWVTHLLCDHAGEIIGKTPMRLRFIADDAVADIGRREALIGVRNHRPDGAGLAVRKVGQVQFASYALDTNIQTWARVIGSTPSAKWVEHHARDADTIEVTSPRNALDLALGGTVRMVLPTFIAQKFEMLTQVSDVIDTLSHDQWLVTHHEDRFLPDVRAAIDRIYRILARSVSDNAA